MAFLGNCFHLTKVFLHALNIYGPTLFFYQFTTIVHCEMAPSDILLHSDARPFPRISDGSLSSPQFPSSSHSYQICSTRFLYFPYGSFSFHVFRTVLRWFHKLLGSAFSSQTIILVSRLFPQFSYRSLLSRMVSSFRELCFSS
jgi:hypothetical protein